MYDTSLFETFKMHMINKLTTNIDKEIAHEFFKKNLLHPSDFKPFEDINEEDV